MKDITTTFSYIYVADSQFKSEWVELSCDSERDLSHMVLGTDFSLPPAEAAWNHLQLA